MVRAVASAAGGILGPLGALALLLATTALVHVFLYRKRLAPATGPMGFLEHLREAGTRTARVGLLFLYWVVVFTTVRFERFAFAGIPLAAPVLDIFDNTAGRVYLFLAQTSLPEGVQVIVTRPTEAVAAQLQVALLLGVLVAFPALAYEAWAFFSPALKPRERRALARSLPVSGVLFLTGAAFAYLFIVPTLFRILYAFAAPLEAAQFLTAGALVGTLTIFAFLFGLAFQLPLVMVLLVRLRVVRPSAYVRRWRHVTVGIFVVAALVTDPTVVSQVIVAAMLLGLYWCGVAASYVASPIPSAPEADATDGLPRA